MKKVIIDAIARKLVLSFKYDGITRMVEPHTVGVSRAGNEVMRGYQIDGGHINPNHDWVLCELKKIMELEVTEKFFLVPRNGYRRGDAHMMSIFAEL